MWFQNTNNISDSKRFGQFRGLISSIIKNDIEGFESPMRPWSYRSRPVMLRFCHIKY